MTYNVTITNHPLIQHKLSIMRRQETNTREFRQLLKEISILMGYEVLRDLPIKGVKVTTPMESMNAPMLACEDICIVPILRAGNGFLEGLLELFPTAKVGLIGLSRNEETLEAVKYYNKLPKDVAKRRVIVIDPMLATGNTASAAIDFVKAAGAKDIKFMSLISAPEGIKAFSEKHPDVEIYTAAVDRCLNSHGYILPGIGDAGDRIFGTN